MAIFGRGRFDPYGFNMNPDFLPNNNPMPGPPPFTTPGIGDGIPGNRRMDGSINLPQQGMPLDVMEAGARGQGLDVPGQPMPDAVTPPTIGFFGKGGQASSPAPMEADQGATMRPSVLADQPIQTAPMDTSQLVQNLIPPKTRFFAKDGAWRDVLGSIGDGLAMASGGKGVYWEGKIKQRDEEREDKRWLDRHNIERSEKVSDRTYDENKPQYFSGSEDRVKFDPATGKAATIFDAPTTAEAYARNFGDAGTDKYRTALQDYTLRSWGDTAVGAKTALEGIRQGGRLNIRGMPTYRDLHPRAAAPRGDGIPTPTKVVGPIMAKQARGEALSDGEQATLNYYRQSNPINALINNLSGNGGGRPSPSPLRRPAPAPAPAMPPPNLGSRRPVRVRTVDEARNLPKGTPFITPDGRKKVR